MPRAGILFSLASLPLLLLPFAAAGGEGGANISGGGNAVVCFDSREAAAQVISRGRSINNGPNLERITSIETYDLYEARLVRGMEGSITPEILPIGEDESPDAYVERVFERLAGILPGLAARFRSVRDSAEERFTTYGPIPRIRDAALIGHVDYSRCAMITLASNTLLEDGGVRIRYDRRLLDHPMHGRLSHAVLKLHEYIYSAGRLSGHENSRATRLLVRALITRSPAIPRRDLIALAIELGFVPTREAPSGAFLRRRVILPAADHAPFGWETYQRLLDGLADTAHETMARHRPEAGELAVEAGEFLGGRPCDAEQLHYCEVRLSDLKRNARVRGARPSVLERIGRMREKIISFQVRRQSEVNTAIRTYLRRSYETDPFEGTTAGPELRAHVWRRLHSVADRVISFLTDSARGGTAVNIVPIGSPGFDRAPYLNDELNAFTRGYPETPLWEESP